MNDHLFSHTISCFSWSDLFFCSRVLIFFRSVPTELWVSGLRLCRVWIVVVVGWTWGSFGSPWQWAVTWLYIRTCLATITQPLFLIGSLFPGPLDSLLLIFPQVLEEWAFQLFPEKSVANMHVWGLFYVCLYLWVRLGIEFLPLPLEHSHHSLTASVAVYKCATLILALLYVIYIVVFHKDVDNSFYP